MLASREVSSDLPRPFAYSFCTMVTDLEEYRTMLAAFAAKGFTATDCEFLYINNSKQNRLDAFASYNRFLLEGRGNYIVLCHQDILPMDQDRTDLDTLLQALSVRDPNWGLCGNAGALATGARAIRISDPNFDNVSEGAPYPVTVISLDENFIIARRDANLALSRNLSGYHWYGSDLCIIADVLGWSCYVIDFHLFHKSGGSMNASFTAGGRALRQKYRTAFRPRWQYVVTKQPVYISASGVSTFLHRAWRKVGKAVGISRSKQ